MDTHELYRVPLDEFVQARTAVVRRLRQAGDREAAVAVARLRKPSAAAWVVDQLAAQAPDLVADLLAAASDALEAQRSLADDGGQALRAATSRFRALLDDVGRRCRAVLEGAGYPVTDATVRQALSTAQAAAGGGRALRDALLHGALDRDHDPAGFGPLDEPEADTDAVIRAIAGRRRSSPPLVTPRARERTARDSRLIELDPAARHAEREAAERRRDADRASAAAVRLRERADRLAAEARAADEEAVAAERAAAAAEARAAQSPP